MPQRNKKTPIGIGRLAVKNFLRQKLAPLAFIKKTKCSASTFYSSINRLGLSIIKTKKMRYIFKKKMHYYFRFRSDGKYIYKALGSNLKTALSERNKLLMKHKPAHV